MAYWCAIIMPEKRIKCKWKSTIIIIVFGIYSTICNLDYQLSFFFCWFVLSLLLLFVKWQCLVGKWVCYNCQNHPISPVRLADSSGFVKQENATVKPEGPNDLTLADDLRLQCDEDMSECTVEVKDIHIQGKMI